MTRRGTRALSHSNSAIAESNGFRDPLAELRHVDHGWGRDRGKRAEGHVDANHSDGPAAKLPVIVLVIGVAPLGLIGVVAARLPTGTPMGFVAILGTIALSGMIIRNSVILIDQMDMAKGLHAWDAVIDATDVTIIQGARVQ